MISLKVETVNDLKRFKKINYKGIPSDQLKKKVHVIIQNHKFIIYMLSVIRIHLKHPSHAKAIASINNQQFLLQSKDMIVEDNEIYLMLKYPRFALRWSRINYEFWLRKFTTCLGPLSKLKKRNQYSSSKECFSIYDTSESVGYILPAYVFTHKHKHKHKRSIEWNKYPIYDLEIYFKMKFHDFTNQNLLEDFLGSRECIDYIHEDYYELIDVISAKVTGYYRNGKANKQIEDLINERERWESDKHQNKSVEKTSILRWVKKFCFTTQV